MPLTGITIKQTIPRSTVLLWVRFHNLYHNFSAVTTFLVLHPRHKLEYFKKHNWDPEWIDTARRIVREEFDRSYAPLLAEAGDASMQVDKEGTVSIRIFINSIH